MGHDFNDVTLDQGAEAVIAAVHNAQAPEPAPAIKIDVELIAADQVQMQPIRWLWPGWFAAGKLHLLGGAPGTGKTTLALALAATLTTAGRWPDANALHPLARPAARRRGGCRRPAGAVPAACRARTRSSVPRW